MKKKLIIGMLSILGFGFHAEAQKTAIVPLITKPQPLLSTFDIWGALLWTGAAVVFLWILFAIGMWNDVKNLKHQK